jgi:hypothetical protein
MPIHPGNAVLISSSIITRNCSHPLPYSPSPAGRRLERVKIERGE